MRTPALVVPLFVAVFGVCVPVARAAEPALPVEPATQQPTPQAGEPAIPPPATQAAEPPAQQPTAPPTTQAAEPATQEPTTQPATQPAVQQPASDQVIEPQLERRDVKVTHIPSNDFEIGAFVGTYDTENFGASLVGGVRLGYHITEDFFAEAVYGQTSVSDQNFRQILPGGIFPNPKETLRYYELLAGYNVFPGEIFLGRTHAKVSTLYLIGGLGSTNFVGESHETFDVGFGMRVFMADWAAVQVDMRDHVFALDLLGTRQNTQNLELTAGLTFFF
jgi:outer membrane beta-barrel protein